jgi:hypothetical protein
MDSPIPSRTTLKSRAKRLRVTLSEQGKNISHAQSREAIAQTYGARDWNTLNARSFGETRTNHRDWQVGQRVSGQYLGHPFTGQIKAARSIGSTHWALTLVFDKAVDVVVSEHFSNLRRQVYCTIGPDGRSSDKTSNGQTQVVLEG